MLTSKQRAILRGLGNNLPDLVYVGKEGVTETVIKQVDTNLFAHELIKIKVQQNAEQELKEIAEVLATKTKSEVVGVIGRKILLYKFTSKKDFKHIEF